MLYRACVSAIIAFWLLMMGMLARVEFSTGDTGGIPVPPDYIWKLIFLHEQASDLVLFTNHQRSGTVHLQPRRLAANANSPVRILSGSGSLMLNVPGLGKQDVVVRGSLELNGQNAVERFELNNVFHEPHPNAPRFTLVLGGEPPRDQWHYQLRSGDTVLKENAGTMAVLFGELNLDAFGINLDSIARLEQQQTASAGTTARRGTLHSNGEDIEAYVVSLKQGEAIESTVYVSQLGQILAVKTFGGYDLYDEAIAP